MLTKSNLKIYFITYLSLIYPQINLYALDYKPQSLCYHFETIEAITLQQAVNITLICNRNIQKAFLGRVTEKYNLDVAEYKFKPNLHLSGNANTIIDDARTNTHDHHRYHRNDSASIIPRFNLLTPLGTTINLDWESIATNPNHLNTFRNASKVTIRQPLLKQFGPSVQNASVENAQDSNQLQILNLSNIIEDEINKTIFSFRAIMQNIMQLDIQEKNLNVSKKLLEQTESLIDAGRLATYEKVQVSSQVASQELNLTDAKINLKKSYLNLINQLGLNISLENDLNKIQIQYDPNISIIEPLSKTSEQLFKTVLTNNINYQNLLTQERINQRDYHTAYDQGRWTLDLIVDHQLKSHDHTYGSAFKKYIHHPDGETTLGVQFDIPLDGNPARSQALIENQIRIKQLNLDKKQLEQEVFSTLQDVLYQQQLLWQKLQIANESVKIKSNSFNMAKQKFAAGRLSSFELIRIQDEVENAKVSQNSSIISYLNNRTILDKLIHNTFKQWSINVQID